MQISASVAACVMVLAGRLRRDLGEKHHTNIPYSRKIWRELNLADWPQPARTKILADLIWRMAELDLAMPRIWHLCVRA